MLNVRTLWQDLQRRFDAVAERLARDTKWAREVPIAWREGPEKQVQGVAGIAAWRAFLAQHGFEA